MSERDNLSYEAWKEYLKSDKEMNERWGKLVELGKKVKNDLKENLESLPRMDALRRRKILTAKNIFNIINTAKQKPNFRWHKKLIRNERDERYEDVIQCLIPSSDYIFRRIKEERGVSNMHGESIDKYLQPVADKIWALKKALQVSIQPETKGSDLSYESMKIGVSHQKDLGAENHYGGKDRDIMDEHGDIVPNPEYEDIHLDSGEEITLPEMEEDGQLKIPF